MSRPWSITPSASQDIAAIADYLATQSGLTAAETFLTEINAILRRIAQFPQIGRKRDELYPNLRSLPYRQCLVSIGFWTTRLRCSEWPVATKT